MTRASRLARWFGLLILPGLLLVGGLGAWSAWRSRTPPQPPVPDLAGADPKVAAVIQKSIGEVATATLRAGLGALGRMLAAHGFQTEAASCFAEAERLDSREPRWPYFRGLSLSLTDPEAAAGELRRALSLWSDAPAGPHLRLADLLLGQGHMEESEKLYLAVLGREPGNSRAHLGLARLARGRALDEEAREHLQASLADPGTERAARSLLAEILQGQGERAGAEAERRRAEDLPESTPPPDPFLEELEARQVGRQASLNRADRLIKEGRAQAAVSLLREAVADDPDFAPSWLGLGRALLAIREARAAETALRRSVQLSPQLVEGWFYLGVARFQQGRIAEATAALREATRLRPGYALAQYNLGQCLKRQNDREGALAAFRAALAAKPHFVQAHVGAAEILLDEGHSAEAREYLKQASELHPEDEQVRLLREKAGER